MKCSSDRYRFDVGAYRNLSKIENANEYDSCGVFTKDAYLSFCAHEVFTKTSLGVTGPDGLPHLPLKQPYSVAPALRRRAPTNVMKEIGLLCQPL